jgi:hypothetical protein
MLCGTSKRNDLTEEEMKIRKEESELFARISEPPSTSNPVMQLLGKDDDDVDERKEKKVSSQQAGHKKLTGRPRKDAKKDASEQEISGTAKKKGRPRTQKPNGSDKVSEETVASSNPKKRRGRPHKSELVGSKNTKESKDKGKKPRKDPLKDSEEVSHDGEPPKKVKEGTAGLENTSSSTPKQPAGKETQNDEEKAKPYATGALVTSNLKRKRGRPCQSPSENCNALEKVKTGADNKSNQNQNLGRNGDVIKESDNTSYGSGKDGLGRPQKGGAKTGGNTANATKTPPTPISKVSATETDESKSAGVASSPRKKRGRPRKSDSYEATEANTTEAGRGDIRRGEGQVSKEASTLEAVFEEISSAPGALGRGRRSKKKKTY